VEDLAKAYVIGKNFAPNPLKHLLIRLEANILPFFGERVAQALTHADFTRYVRARREQGVTFSTIHREITDIKAIFNWAARRHPPMIAGNPARDFENPREDNAIIFPPTKKEIQAILAKAPQHLARAIHLSFYTGLRPGAVELLSLTWDHVNFEDHIIHINSAHKGGPIRREVPIHKDLLKLLKKWRTTDKKLFPSPPHQSEPRSSESEPRPQGSGSISPPFAKWDQGGFPIIHYRGKPIKSIKTAWKKTLADAGIIRRIRPYDLRHQFITSALESGADLKTVSEIVGSSPKTILKHYQHVSTKMRKKLIDQMPGL
jgi:integrase